MAEGVVELTDQNFEDTIKGSDTPVLVDFWAEWCGPCRRVGPIVEELAGDYSGKLVVAKVDIDANQQTAQKHGIASIPTLLFFKDGEVVDQVVGARPKQDLVQNIERVLGN